MNSLALESKLDKVLLSKGFVKQPRSVLPHAVYNLVRMGNEYYVDLIVHPGQNDLEDLPVDALQDPFIDVVLGAKHIALLTIAHFPVCKMKKHSQALRHWREVVCTLHWMLNVCSLDGFFIEVEKNPLYKCAVTGMSVIEFESLSVTWDVLDEESVESKSDSS